MIKKSVLITKYLIIKKSGSAWVRCRVSIVAGKRLTVVLQWFWELTDVNMIILYQRTLITTAHARKSPNCPQISAHADRYYACANPPKLLHSKKKNGGPETYCKNYYVWLAVHTNTTGPTIQ